MYFFYVFSGFLTLIYLYTGFRFIPSLIPRKRRIISWSVLLALLLTLLVHLYFRVTFTHPKFSQILAWIGYSSLGCISLLFCLALCRDILIVLSLLIFKIRGILFKSSPLSIEAPDRRRFLFKTSGYAMAALGSSASFAGVVTALQKPRVVDIHVPLKPDHKKLKGLTLVQFTDLHVGPTVKYDYVKQSCDIISKINADIIVFTGDLADGSPRHLARDVSPIMKLDAPLGKYFITGNHEYYSGVKRWLHMAKILGFDILINEHRVIRYNGGKLALAGVTDLRGGTFFKSHSSSPQKALAGCPEDIFRVLLAHQPPSIYATDGLNIDLQISGHTHGGQYFPFQYFILAEHPFVKGRYRFKNTTLYVSQGTGYWGPPIRIGTFPEITRFTFR